MGNLDKDAAAYERLAPYVHADFEHDRPLRAIDYIVDMWPENMHGTSMKKQGVAWLQEAITMAGGDADLFTRTYTKNKDVELAVKVACGHIFWMEAQALYRDMVAGKRPPEDVYLLIEADLRHAGKTPCDKRQHRFSQYSLTPDRALTDKIRSELWAREMTEPPRADIAQTAREILVRTMEKHLKAAHLAPGASQLGL